MSARRKSQKEKENAQDSSPDRPRHHAFWSGTITFGLVSIPVDFYPATRHQGSSLRLVTQQGHPVGKRYICPADEQTLDADEIVRGIEIDSGEFVALSDEELESVAPEKTRDIDLKRFVARADLPVILFSRSYVLAPSGQSTKAYRLLAETMQRSDHAGIASFVMRDKAYMVAILAEDGVMRAEILRFTDEIRTPDSIGLPKPPRIPAARTKQMLDSIDSLMSDQLDLNALSDQHGTDLKKLVKDKLKRKKDVLEVETEAETESDSSMDAPIDLVALLKERLEKSDTAPHREGTSPSLKTRSSRTTADLEKKPKSDLYARAKKLGIDGRSTMNKKDLVSAIKKAAG